jgi:hypothetical protein
VKRFTYDRFFRVKSANQPGQSGARGGGSQVSRLSIARAGVGLDPLRHAGRARVAAWLSSVSAVLAPRDHPPRDVALPLIPLELPRRSGRRLCGGAPLRTERRQPGGRLDAEPSPRGTVAERVFRRETHGDETDGGLNLDLQFPPLLGLALRRIPGIYRRGIARGRGDRMARLRSGRRSHKQDQLNSNGIPRFLDFFSRGTGSSNPSPSSGESVAN